MTFLQMFSMEPLLFLVACGSALAASGVFAPSDRLARLAAGAGTMAAGAASLGLAASVLASGRSLALAFPGVLAAAGGVVFTLDPLGAVFLAIVGGVAIPAGLYGIGYCAAYEGRYSLRWMALNTGVFLISMTVVICAGNVVTFVLGWELMALSSYFLVNTEHRRRETRRAGLWYLVMAHGGLLAVFTAFVITANNVAGAWTFESLRVTGAQLPQPTRHVVFFLALVGFGSKAGLVPVHVWLPRAHPAAPSHVSAFMSAAMVKMGVYGLLRVCLDLLGAGPWWWGAVIIVAGAISALTGVLYALVEDDLKRLLAYSTVENVGLVFLGVGAGFLFVGLGQPGAASLAFAAALLHAVNHAAFKTVLFMGAGAVLHATDSRDMNGLGGLIHRMPWTAACFLAGSVAISALPPLNGFTSEWLLFQSFLPGVASSRASVAVLLTIGVGALALASGLAATTFVKAFGISFLALPRSPAAHDAHEAPVTMRLGMVTVALACPALAVFTGPLISALGSAVASVSGVATIAPARTSALAIETAGAMGRMSPVALMAALGAAVLGTWLLIVLAGSRSARRDDTWGCGRTVQTARTEYTSTSFAEPLRRIFGELYRPTEHVAVKADPKSPYFVQSIEYRAQLLPWFERFLYGPLAVSVRALSTVIRALQSGSVNAYLAYMVAVLILLVGMVIGF